MSGQAFDPHEPCPGAPPFSDSHRFEPRYDKKLTADRGDWFWTTTTTTGPISAEMIEAAKDTITYVRDVCVRCGATIERVVPKPTL